MLVNLLAVSIAAVLTAAGGGLYSFLWGTLP